MRLRGVMDRILLVLVLAPFALTFLFTFLPPFSSVMLQSLLVGDGARRDWVPIQAIAPVMLQAAIAAEDGRFCEHNGIDWKAVDATMDRNARSGRLHGASTITMQVAKNLFLWNGRSWLRKTLEAPLALWLDFAWSKERILEVYLNIAQWGDGRFGVELAAKRAFGKPASRLTMWEASLLTAALPAPTTRNAGTPSAYQAGLARTIALRIQQSPDIAYCVRPLTLGLR